MQAANLNVHHFIPFSRANGPGSRAVLWLQGCHLRCPGCINPETHAPEEGHIRSINDLLHQITELTDIEGITISGGEPLEQSVPLTALLKQIRQQTGLSILVFSGLTLSEIQQLPSAKAFQSNIDILVAGRYQQKQPIRKPLVASENQRVHFFSDRYTPADLQHIPDTEILIRPDGGIEITGIAPFSMEREP